MLDTIGFAWDAQAADWLMQLAKLEDYKREHGDCLVPRSYGAKNGNLGLWVSRQRDSHKNGTLKDDRVRRLDDIGFAWISTKRRRTAPKKRKAAELEPEPEPEPNLKPEPEGAPPREAAPEGLRSS